jgi:hypothetical protein
MPNKMERFNQRARRVLSLAQVAAEEFKHHIIDTEHMLLALMREEGGMAGRVLRDLELEQQRVEELVVEMSRATARTDKPQLDLSPGTKRVLELAVDEARRMGHHYIGTEHLLLGLVRQSDGVAIEILQRLGVSPEEVRRQTRRALHELPVQGQSSVRLNESGNITRTHISGQTFSPYETPSFKIMNAATMKILDMIEAGKLNTAQGAELLSALQPWFSTSLGEKALLVAQFNQPENIQKRHLRVVVSNIATNHVRFEMTFPLQDALNSVEAILGAVSAQFIGRLWTEDIDTTNRIEVYIDENESPSAESGDSDVQ